MNDFYKFMRNNNDMIKIIKYSKVLRVEKK